MACKRIVVRGKHGIQYLIHWSGGATFVVQVFGTTMTVYTSKYAPDIEPDKKVFSTDFTTLYVPSSLKPSQPQPADVCSLGLAGNSLLAHIKDNTYIYIGHDVVEMTLDEPVEGYYSELVPGFAGNTILKIPADAPLAYAVTEHYVYCFHTMCRHDRNIFPTLDDIIPPLKPATDYAPALKSAMKNATRITKIIMVKYVSY